jgi:hypothetical protein
MLQTSSTKIDHYADRVQFSATFIPTCQLFRPSATKQTLQYTHRFVSYGTKQIQQFIKELDLCPMSNCCFGSWERTLVIILTASSRTFIGSE